jgi:hypothetical protein
MTILVSRGAHLSSAINYQSLKLESNKFPIPGSRPLRDILLPMVPEVVSGGH